MTILRDIGGAIVNTQTKEHTARKDRGRTKKREADFRSTRWCVNYEATKIRWYRRSRGRHESSETLQEAGETSPDVCRVVAKHTSDDGAATEVPVC